MTVAFTDPTAGDFDMHSLAWSDELWDAAEERGAVGQFAPPSRPTEDEDFHKIGPYAGLYALMAWMEAACLNFIDHTYGGGDFTGEAVLPQFTLTTWRAAAGLNSGGFRRVTSWDGVSAPSFSYGMPEEDDIVGYWIAEDILAGLSAMKWTGAPVYGVADYTERYGKGWTDVCADAVADNATIWALGWQTPGSLFVLYSVWARSVAPNPPYTSFYDLTSLRVVSKAVINNISTVVPCSIDFYLFPQTDAGIPFVDIDGLGFAENRFWLAGTWPSAQTAVRTAPSYTGYIDTNPAVIMGYDSCPLTDQNASVICYGGTARGVLKWDFTNSNA